MKYLLLLAILSVSLEFETKGVDLSKYDENVDFKKLKEGGYTFVILKAGSGKSGKDPVFEKYYSAAKAAKLNVGAYWYSYARSEEDGTKDANNMLSILGDKKFEYPIYYDVEDATIFKRKLASKISKKFCDFMESKKYYCGLYSSTSFFNDYFSKEVKEKYDIWVAQYGPKCKYTGKYQIWQNSETGKVPGIKGNCDTNICYFDYPTLIKEKHFNGY